MTLVVRLELLLCLLQMVPVSEGLQACFGLREGSEACMHASVMHTRR